MKNILTTSILALVGFVVSSQSAQAGGQPVGFGDNDLLLGFRTNNNPGQTINLELNLGTADTYYNPGGNAPLDFSSAVGITNIGRLSVTDLTSAYGSGWASRTDLNWGIVGTSGTSGSYDGFFGLNTIYLSRAETVAGTQTTPWSRQNNFNAANTQISSLGGGYTGTSTATSDYDLLVAAGSSNSYQSRSGGVSGATFGAVGSAFANDSIVAKFNTGNWISIQDIYALEQGSGYGVYLGSFALRANGSIDYSPTASAFGLVAVPEPGTAVFGIATFAIAALRRRRNAATVVA